MGKSTLGRIVWDFLLLLSVFFAPWPATAIVAFLGSAYFGVFVEAIIAGGLFDYMYSSSQTFPMSFIGLCGAVLVFLVGNLVRDKILFVRG